jgi:2-keto-4-pentenoate hydratase/2-oxohepta-3-ene-1,7-dioic acid hydratase in catechol pathway
LLLYRLGPEGFYAAASDGEPPRMLYSDPFDEPPSRWRFGRAIDLALSPLMAPVLPGKIVGIGRSYAEHARELGNPVPDEPLVFLKSPGTVIGPGAPVVLPPESGQVEYEGEIALVLRSRLSRPSRDQVAAAILGITAACDVTARDLQRRDKTFARGKSFDSFCPLGPAIKVGPDWDALEVVTRINGEERQRGRGELMLWDVFEMVRYVAQHMSLDPGDVVLTGTPAGVGTLSAGDLIEVEVAQVGILANPVEGWQTGPPTEN